MQKIACIFSFEESNWVSCQKIVLNLHKSYEACRNKEIQNFNLPHSISTMAELEELSKNIKNFAPDVLAIMDHKPHPLQLIQSLSELYKDTKKPKIIFHIFGDFSIYFHLWERVVPFLQGFQIEFLVASDRQKILIDKMLLLNKSVVCPFPVDPLDFYPGPELRQQQRKEWNLTDKDVVFIFTGRLSRQKKIKTLINSFASELKNEPNAHLYLYGNSDNIGDPFLGVQDLEGEYFRVFYNAYKALSSELQKRIHFMGAVPNAQLLKVYQGADVFINLSVHNDEDYGMSVAEAQFVGLPVGLTDWGGLASFHHPQIPQATSFIPVRIGKSSKQISIAGVKKTIRQYYEAPETERRAEISQVANAKFGILKVAKTLDEILVRESSAFQGFSPLLYQASTALQVGASDPMYLTSKQTVNQLYREIYSSYVR